MYLDEDMLKNFGGVDVNSLNYITGAENDNQHEISEPFPENSLQSNYFNQEHLVSMFKKQKRTFSILSVNIQSLNAKINQLRIILADLDQQGINLARYVCKKAGCRMTLIQLYYNQMDTH